MLKGTNKFFTDDDEVDDDVLKDFEDFIQNIDKFAIKGGKVFNAAKEIRKLRD